MAMNMSINNAFEELISASASLPQYSVPGPAVAGSSKYAQLLAIIDELGKDIRPTYTGNKICMERLKRTIIHARILVRECLLEADKERNAANAKIASTATTTSTTTTATTNSTSSS